jgi:hypothetical protein
MRKLFPGRYVRLQERAAEAKAHQDELEEQEKLSRLQTKIDLPTEVRTIYSQLLDAFAIVVGCERKWDTVSRTAANRLRERTAASHTIDRQPVTFRFGSCDLIESEWKVPCLENANGGDLFLYPGFVLVHVSDDAFALLEVSEIELEGAPTTFIEEETVPADSRVVSQTWKKANKDGSPDRRFTNNYPIPIVEYGKLAITSPTGLNEEYMVSNVEAVVKLGSIWEALRRAVLATTT